MPRRLLLAAGTLIPVGLLAACVGGSSSDPTNSSPSGSSEDPHVDDAILQTAASAEAALITGYEATIAAHPDLASTLNSLLSQHKAHAAAVGPGPTMAPSPPVSVSSDKATALAALVTLEKSTAASHSSGAIKAQGSNNVRLLTLMAASEASHAAYLGSASNG